MPYREWRPEQGARGGPSLAAASPPARLHYCCSSGQAKALGPSQGIVGKAAFPGAGSALGHGGAAPGGGEELSQGSGEGAETVGADGAQGCVCEHPTGGKCCSGVTLNSSLPGPARSEAHGQGAGRLARPARREEGLGKTLPTLGEKTAPQSRPLTLPLKKGRGG